MGVLHHGALEGGVDETQEVVRVEGGEGGEGQEEDVPQGTQRQYLEREKTRERERLVRPEAVASVKIHVQYCMYVPLVLVITSPEVSHVIVFLRKHIFVFDLFGLCTLELKHVDLVALF